MGNEVKQENAQLDSASALIPRMNYLLHDQQAAKAYRAMREGGELSKNSPSLEMAQNMEIKITRIIPTPSP